MESLIARPCSHIAVHSRIPLMVTALKVESNVISCRNKLAVLVYKAN